MLSVTNCTLVKIVGVVMLILPSLKGTAKSVAQTLPLVYRGISVQPTRTV